MVFFTELRVGKQRWGRPLRHCELPEGISSGAYNKRPYEKNRHRVGTTALCC